MLAAQTSVYGQAEAAEESAPASVANESDLHELPAIVVPRLPLYSD